MSPGIYPDFSWSGRLNRTVRTLQIVAIAGAIGAVAGGISVLAVISPLNDSAASRQSRHDVRATPGGIEMARPGEAAVAGTPQQQVQPPASTPSTAAQSQSNIGAANPPAALPPAQPSSTASATQPATTPPAAAVTTPPAKPGALAAKETSEPGTSGLFNRAEPLQATQDSAKRVDNTRIDLKPQTRRKAEHAKRPAAVRPGESETAAGVVVDDARSGRRVIILQRPDSGYADNDRGGWRHDYSDNWRGGGGYGRSYYDRGDWAGGGWRGDWRD